MRLRAAIGLAVLVAGVVAAPGAPAAGQAPSARQLFDRYLAGDREGVVAEIARRQDFDGLAREIARQLVDWVIQREASTDVRIDVATFLLDVSAARFETDWRFVRDLVEIGCRLLAPVPERLDAARRWHLAALALTEGAADPQFLLARPTVDLDAFDHLAHSREQFPDEARFRLAEVVVSAMGFADQAPARDRPVPSDEALETAGSSGRASLVMRRGQRRALADFLALTSVPEVADEARLRAGHQAYLLAEDDRALEQLAAAATADDPFIAYNAHLIASMVHTRRGQRANAERELRRALAVVPFAQSAVQLLSSQLFLAGRTADAHDLVEQWFAHRPRPVDPWRLFGYGDFRHLPVWLSLIRKDVGR